MLVISHASITTASLHSRFTDGLLELMRTRVDLLLMSLNPRLLMLWVAWVWHLSCSSWHYLLEACTAQWNTPLALELAATHVSLECLITKLLIHVHLLNILILYIWVVNFVHVHRKVHLEVILASGRLNCDISCRVHAWDSCSLLIRAWCTALYEITQTGYTTRVVHHLITCHRGRDLIVMIVLSCCSWLLLIVIHGQLILILFTILCNLTLTWTLEEQQALLDPLTVAMRLHDELAFGSRLLLLHSSLVNLASLFIDVMRLLERLELWVLIDVAILSVQHFSICIWRCLFELLERLVVDSSFAFGLDSDLTEKRLTFTATQSRLTSFLLTVIFVWARLKELISAMLWCVLNRASLYDWAFHGDLLRHLVSLIVLRLNVLRLLLNFDDSL